MDGTKVTPFNTGDQGILVPQIGGTHIQWLQAGFLDTIPVIPAGAALHETSKVDPDARGKCPGDYFGGAWDGLGSWPSYEMNGVKAARLDELGANTGLKMGGRWTGLDVDLTDQDTAQAMLNRIHELGGGEYFVRWGQVPKFMVLFQIAPGETIRRRQYPIRRNGETQRIEIMGVTAKGRPSQAVVAGIHPKGATYQWNRPLRADLIHQATAAQMDYLVSELMTIAEGYGWTKGRASNVNTSNDGLSGLGSEPHDPRLIGPVVDLIRNDDLEYDDWIGIAYAIKNSCGGGGWEMFERFSAQAPKNDPAYTKRIWDGFDADGYSGFGKLVYWARQSNGGVLPGDLELRVKQGMVLKQAMQAGMPEIAPQVPVPLGTVPGAAVTGEVLPADGQPVLAHHGDGQFQFTSVDGKLVANYANVLATLTNNDIWRGVFAFDTFNNKRVIMRDMPWLNATAGQFVADAHYRGVHAWMQAHLFNKIGYGDVLRAVQYAADRNTFDPLATYLNGLQWDGVPRIGAWLWTYCGVDATACDPAYMHYLAAVGRKWLIAAVARALEPGCQADNALIFEGPQGVGKSSALAALCPNRDWFGDSLPDFHHKDAKSYLQGRWIIEMAELTQVHRGELENMRSFLTTPVDIFRPSYGVEEIIVPRRNVFAGSTNRDDYLRDPAGERRMWIVQTDGKFDVEGLRGVRDQLWAEAVRAYGNGEQWHLTSGEETSARQIQMDRVQVDPWQDTLASLLANRPETSLPECFALMGIADKERTTAQRNRIKTALAGLGYVRKGRTKARGTYRDAIKYTLK